MTTPGTSYKHLFVATAALSGLLTVALLVAYGLTGSQLAFAQGADSLLDVLTASVLGWTVIVAAQPSDEEHPFGHTRAEPIGALVTAVIAGVLAIEVGRGAVGALLTDAAPVMSGSLLALFATKLVAKTIIAGLAWRLGRRTKSPAVRALLVDARNDALFNAVAIVGFFGTKYGWVALDAWLAVPVAIWIGYSGFDLARENIALLLGAAPPVERQQELLAIAQEIPGVDDAHDLLAQFLGTELQVQLHVVVDDQLTVLAGHDIGEAVREALLLEPDVGHVSVHVDVEMDGTDHLHHG